MLNFFAPMQLIQKVLPGMRARRSGMIVNISSIGTVRGALELASEALAKETEHLGIRVMLVEPGAFRTRFYGEDLQESAIRISDYDILASRYRKAFIRHDQPGDPQRGAEIIVENALRKDTPMRLVLGSDALRSARQVLQARLLELERMEQESRKSGKEDRMD